MKKEKYDLGGEKTMITEHLQNNAFKYNFSLNIIKVKFLLIS